MRTKLISLLFLCLAPMFFTACVAEEEDEYSGGRGDHNGEIHVLIHPNGGGQLQLFLEQPALATTRMAPSTWAAPVIIFLI